MKTLRLPVLLSFLYVSAILAESDELIRSRIRRQSVISTNVAAVGYSHRLRALEIEFTRGAIYRFLEVPPALYQGLLSAQSKGHFIAENLGGKYRFIKVRPGRMTPPRSRLTNERSQAHASTAP